MLRAGPEALKGCSGGGLAPVKRQEEAWVAKRRSSGVRSPKKITCEECFFRKQMLCALALDEPCSTFRPDRPEGLTPPRQPALLLRDPAPSGAHALRAA